MWDPAVYQRFGSERSRPFFDLTARIGAERPGRVVDLGCGPGDLTATLAERWPSAAVTGIDSAPEMIAEAQSRRGSGSPRRPEDQAPAAAQSRRGSGSPRRPEDQAPAAEDQAPAAAQSRQSTVTFRVGDVRDWRPDADVVVSNATLQWVPGHPELLTRWATELPAGAWIAVQVPGNFDAPSHRALREVARSTPFAAAVGDVVREAPVDDPAGYAERLIAVGARVDAWETTYLHLLPDDRPEHPVLRWMEGTALRPVRAALEETAWQEFRAALAERLADAYPARYSVVPFPFRRIFVVAQTSS